MKLTLKTTMLAATIGLVALAGCSTEARIGETPMLAVPGMSATPVNMEGNEEDNTHNAVPEFIGITGEVVEIEQRYSYFGDTLEAIEGMYLVLVESWDEDRTKINFLVDEATILLLDTEIEVGMPVFAHYNATLPAPAIYPPQFHAAVFRSQEIPGGAFIDRFDENWNASFWSYQLEIQEDTEIILQDGNPFEGELAELENRALVVLYDAIPRVVEPPTPVVPTKIIVLFERAVHPIHELTEEELAMIENNENFMSPIGEIDDWQGGLQLTPEDLELFWASVLDPETAQILVDDNAIEAPTPFICRDSGHVMLPAAYVAEALGYNVYGEGADIVIGPGITFTVGVDSYFIGRMAPMQLFAAPVLQDEVLFVPLSFFYSVLPHTAYVEDGNIIVRTAEDSDIE